MEYLNKTPLAEVWKVRDSHNRLWWAQCLSLAAGAGGDLLTRLPELHHPGLLPALAVQAVGGRVAVLSELHRRTLRDCYQEHAAKGLPGIPREELLGYLRQATTVLDQFASQKLFHLGLHPRSLVLGDEQVQVADLGLLPLAWLPTGQPDQPLNRRYPPGVAQPGGSAGADQFSLALIYVEMLTGVHPFHSRNGKDSIGGRGRKLDLDFLPATDRDIIGRAPGGQIPGGASPPVAISWTPWKWPAARRLAGNGRSSCNCRRSCACCHLNGRSLILDTTLPAVADLVTDLISAAAGAVKVLEFNNFRYLVHPGNALEHRCNVRLFTGGLKLRMQGFHEEWKGRVVQQDASSFTYHVFGRHRCGAATASDHRSGSAGAVEAGHPRCPNVPG